MHGKIDRRRHGRKEEVRGKAYLKVLTLGYARLGHYLLKPAHAKGARGKTRISAGAVTIATAGRTFQGTARSRLS